MNPIYLNRQRAPSPFIKTQTEHNYQFRQPQRSVTPNRSISPGQILFKTGYEYQEENKKLSKVNTELKNLVQQAEKELSEIEKIKSGDNNYELIQAKIRRMQEQYQVAMEQNLELKKEEDNLRQRLTELREEQS